MISHHGGDGWQQVCIKSESTWNSEKEMINEYSEEE